MEGILKSAPQPQSEKKVEQPRAEGISSPEIIHQEYLDFFNLKYSDRDNEQFKYVVNWAKQGKSLGDALLTLSRLETKLGAPSGMETKLHKIYNYVRTTSNLENRKGALKETLDGIKNKHKAFLSQLEKEYGNKVSKLNAEIQKATNDYNIARNRHENQATNKTKSIRQQYAEQLAELKKMRAAYKG